MKKIFSLILALVMCLSFCACGDIQFEQINSTPSSDITITQTTATHNEQNSDSIDDSVATEPSITETTPVETIPITPTEPEATDSAEPTETETPLINPEENNDEPNCEKNSFQLGIYLSSDSPLDTLIINTVSQNTIRFSAAWYRTNSIDYITAEVSENRATFDYTDSDFGHHAKGIIEISSGKDITLTLTESSYAYIAPGTYNYQYFGSEQQYSDSLDQALLLRNDDQCGWHAIKNPDDTNPTDCFLRFYENGKYAGWIMESWGGDSFVSVTTTGQYEIIDGVLYLDGNAYDIHAESTGSAFMFLTAIDSYETDFSGNYYLREDFRYSYLVANIPHS